MTTAAGTVPLARGRHGDPARGMCFLEQTALLAREPVTHSPRCVDAELAAVLRSANDALTDDERTALLPLLGRAVGLVVPVAGSAAGRAGIRVPPPGDGAPDEPMARTAALRQAVAQRLLAGVGIPPEHPRWGWYAGHARVSRLFWELLDEPAPAGTPAGAAARLVERLDLLHRCYEEALAGLAAPR